MKLFAQIRKVDEARRLVFGRAAEEVVDKSDEIMDYASSKPHFQKWSEDVAKDTDGKSLGNVRAMHGKVAAGKLTGIDFNDTEKAIDICAKVVDDAEWKKVIEGVYTGFSMGGSYVGDKKVEKMDGRDVSRYTAKPNEISLVDRPCIPTATFFEVQKADGTLSKVDFKTPAEEDGGTINGTPEEVDQLVKLMAANKLSLADVLTKIAPPATPVVEGVVTAPAVAAVVVDPAAKVEKLDSGALRKSMWTCSELALVISSLQGLKSSATYEAFYEGDDTGIARKLGAVIALAGEVLVQMIQEEVSEGDGAETTLVVELSDKVKGLAKFEGDALMDLIKAGARNSKTDAARISKIHDLSVELGHACEAAKAAPTGEIAKVDAPANDAMQKMVADAVAPLQKALGEANEKITKLEAQPMPARVVLRTVSKADDVGDGAAPANKPEAIVDDHGDKHEAAGLIKALHSSGGEPLVRPLSK